VKRVRQFAAGYVLVVALPLLAADALLKNTDLVGGASLPLICTAAFAVVFWTITAHPVRLRLPTIRIGRQGRSRVLYFDPPTKPVRRKRGFRKRAEEASSAILGLLADYEHDDPGRQPWWAPYPNWDALPQEERTRIFNEHTQHSIDRLTQLMTRYESEYSIEALALFDEFQKRGLTGNMQRKRFEWPVNTFGLREVGQSLGVWAKQL
jgi:hypothetical protein